MRIRTNSLQRIAGLAGLLVGMSVSVSASAQQIMVSQGGPVLSSFTIYPYFYGAGWGANTSAYAVVAAQKNLTDIAAFISGTKVPTGLKTVISQYGVHSATVAPAVLGPAAPPATLKESDIQTIISNAFVAAPPHRLHGYGATALIMVIFSSGFAPDFSQNGGGADWGRHQNPGTNQYYAYTFADVPAATTFPVSAFASHEIFEAATDPQFNAWVTNGKEICDGPCQAGVHLWDYNGTLIAAPFDNTISGACSTTGYDPPTPFDPLTPLFPLVVVP